MNKRLVTALAASASFALALPLAAEDKPANPAGAGMGAIYKNISETLAKAAEKMPEDKYSFKPTPEVRSFGQLVAHVADAQNFMCKMAVGEQGAYSDAVEKGKTAKADLVAALKESSAGCAKVFAQSHEDLAKPQKIFGMDMNRYAVASIVLGHAYEHYGNMVTYLRINKIVPPSSEQRQAPAPKTEAKATEDKK